MLWASASSAEEIKLGSVVLKGNVKTIALSAVTLLIIFLTAGSVIFILIGLAGTVVLLHAIVHLPEHEDDEPIELQDTSAGEAAAAAAAKIGEQV
jgi:hypothetical protein